MTHGETTVEGPPPVHALVERPGRIPDLRLLAARSLEVSRHRESPGRHIGRIDRRDLGERGAPPGLEIEKVIVEAAVTAGVGLRPMRRFEEELEAAQGPGDAFGTREKAALEGDRQAGETEPDGCDARRRAF